MAGHGGWRSPPLICNTDPRPHAHGASSAGASLSHGCSRDPPAFARFADFSELPLSRPPQRTYLNIHQRLWGTCVVEITDRETHQRKWIGSFHTAELAAMEYDRWQVRYHGSAARLNFPFETAPVHLVPPEPGVVSVAMAREDQEARERLEAEAAAAASMEDLRRQHQELMEAERAYSPRTVGRSLSSLTTRWKAARRAARKEAMRRSSTSRSGGASSPTATTTTPAPTQLSPRVA
ncbi:hypothetical protein VPH35_051070 [Triticum aestivum]|uniref:AP2/ERF domain-containing protein n=1 Tax=Triticum aestivum TaxID=4565 RepID=A0A077RV88_WHEAT|nr:unnamed protein product [Triticum aestivum]